MTDQEIQIKRLEEGIESMQRFIDKPMLDIYGNAIIWADQEFFETCKRTLEFYKQQANERKD